MAKPTHAIERTSPKGPGTTFLGTCIRCGMKNLPATAALEECENVAGISNDDALITMLSPPPERA